MYNFWIFVCYEEKEEIRRVRMKMKHNRKVLFITSIRCTILEKCYHHTHITKRFCFGCICSTHPHRQEEKKKIKSLFFCLLHSPKKNTTSSWYLCFKPLTLCLLKAARKIVWWKSLLFFCNQVSWLSAFIKFVTLHFFFPSHFNREIFAEKEEKIFLWLFFYLLFFVISHREVNESRM